MFIGFQHNKFLVSATNAVIGNRGTGLPASVGNGIVLVGYPMTDLKTAIEIARDLTQMRVQVSRVGTQFGRDLCGIFTLAARVFQTRVLIWISIF